MQAELGIQEHGYRNGHELLHGTIKLGRDDQDTVDRLSDIAGPTRPGEQFEPYLTAYSLPSRTYYVLARTWQDLAAPRAGCVVTKSIFIPMSDWECTKHIPELVEELNKASFTSITGTFTAEPTILRPIADPRKTELVEALFLETRKPIVYFDAKDAEDIIVRLLLALWPNLRRTFAACSFALSPRRISGREFDLLFAPNSARSRFADWPGRKIAASTAPAPRHRWSSSMASQIFEATVPSLQSNDGLGLLTSDPNADESSLRLSLLWNELSSKAAQTPSAVLGMLDIVNSQDNDSKIFSRSLVPALSSALSQIVAAENPAGAWQFLSALFGKFPGHVLPAPIVSDVEMTSRELTRKDPEAALSALSDELLHHHVPPAAMYRGVAKGLTEVKLSRALFDAIIAVPRDGIIGLIIASDVCATMLVSLAKQFGKLAALAAVFAGLDKETIRVLRRSVVPLIYGEDDSVLLSPILAGVSAKELADIAVEIFSRTAFDGKRIGDAIVSAARSDAALSAVRSEVASRFDSPASDHFLQETLGLDRGSIEWLSADQVSPQRSRRLLMGLLAQSSDRDLLAGQRDSFVLQRIVTLLAGDVETTAPQMARLLDLGQFDSKSLFELSYPLLPYLKLGSHRGLLLSLIEIGFTSAAVADPRVANVVTAAATLVGSAPLIDFLASRKATEKRIGENVRILDGLPKTLREDFLKRIDVVSEKLVSRNLRGCGASVYEAWANLLTDAEAHHLVSFARAAPPTLAFAMRQTNDPVSPLIVATFPIVHGELMKSGDEPVGLSLPMMMLAPITMFMDWDKAKSARKDLISAFMHSSWPPADLLKVADKAGIAKKIVQRVKRSYDGEQYLHKMELDVRKRSAKPGGDALRALWSSVTHADVEEWD